MSTCITTSWKAGASPSFTISTVDDDGDAADPSSLVVVETVPDGTATTYTYGVDSEIVKSSTGVYVFTGPVSVDPADGLDIGYITVTTVSGGRTDVETYYYRIVTP